MTVPASWEIWLGDPLGERICPLDEAYFYTCSKVANSPGYFSLTLPSTFPTNKFRLDGLVEFWRRPRDGDRQLIGVYFLRRAVYATDTLGQETIQIGGPGTLDLLRRRIVAYKAGTSQATKTDYADDMIKAIVLENLGASAGAGRDLSAYITIDGDRSDGVSLTKSFAYGQVLEACQKIADASRAEGTEVYFDFVPTPQSAGRYWNFRFVTYTGQPGMDRTSGNVQTVFGVEWDNLEQSVLGFDYTEEENYIYAAGQGQDSLRNVRSVYDASRYNMSIWNRCEGFADARNESTNAGVDAAGNTKLIEGRPTLKLTGKLLDTPQTRYGIEWAWGDRVWVSGRGHQLEAVVRAVSFNVDQDGNESIDARVECESSGTIGLGEQ